MSREPSRKSQTSRTAPWPPGRRVTKAAASRTAGQASATGFAYLTDRVRVKQKRPQVYGTQYHAAVDADGNMIQAEGGGFAIAIEFEDIREADREVLIQHVLRKQAAELRSARRGAAA